MVHVRNYETMSKFVKLCLGYCRVIFSGDGVYYKQPDILIYLRNDAALSE